MGAMTAHTRLAHLLELADKGPTLRAALAEEVAELLTEWPSDYPAEMRAICETLLARAARELDADARAHLRVRLYADPGLVQRILPREAQSQSLLELARQGGDVAAALAARLEISADWAVRILDDKSCVLLAAAVRAADLGRPTFSALAVLAHGAVGAAELDAYDAVSVSDAARQLRGWRQSVPHAA
jgi:hypothetical protein